MELKVFYKAFITISAIFSFLVTCWNSISINEILRPANDDITIKEVDIIEIDEETTPETEIVIYEEETTLETKEEVHPDKEEIVIIAREDVEAIARTLYGECRGVSSDMEKAAVAWVILNRVDTGDYGDTVLDVVSYPWQFEGYDPSYPVLDELAELAEDVMLRWYREKMGDTDVGRVLPSEYLWFHGDGEHNYFRDSFEGGNRWYWSYWNPYEN